MKRAYNESAETEYRSSKPRLLKAPVPYKYAPPSVMMMAEILGFIAALKYDASPESIDTPIIVMNEQSFAFAFLGYDESLVEECGFRDAGDYDGLRNMFEDLRALCLDDRAIVIKPDRLTIICADKAKLHNLLEVFIDKDHHDLTTLDNEMHSSKGKGGIQDLFQQWRQDPKAAEEYYITSETNRLALETCRPVVCMSREFFYLEMVRSKIVDIPISFAHLLKTIKEEDHSLPEQVNHHSFLSGGYN